MCFRIPGLLHLHDSGVVVGRLLIIGVDKCVSISLFHVMGRISCESDLGNAVIEGLLTAAGVYMLKQCDEAVVVFVMLAFLYVWVALVSSLASCTYL